MKTPLIPSSDQLELFVANTENIELGNMITGLMKFETNGASVTSSIWCLNLTFKGLWIRLIRKQILRQFEIWIEAISDKKLIQTFKHFKFLLFISETTGKDSVWL